MLFYEKALRMTICTFIMAEENPSESKFNETISVKELFDCAKIRYTKMKEKFDAVLNKVKLKIPCAKEIVMFPYGDIALVLEEDYFGDNISALGDSYDGVYYDFSFEKGKIQLKIFLNDIEKIVGKKESEVYFEKGILERIYKGGKSWVKKMLLEVKEEILEVKDFIEKNNYNYLYYINTISNSFEINIFPVYFSISDISSTLMYNYRKERNFSINYYFNQKYFDDELKKYKTIDTFEGEFKFISESRRIEKLLNRKVSTEDGDVEILIEFIKNLRVYKNEVPIFFKEKE